MVAMAMAMAIVRKKALRRIPASAGSGGSRGARVIGLSVAVFVLITLPVSAQYGSSVPETPGSAGRPTGLAPLPTTALGVGQRSWEIVPTLSVGETYTDNISLSNSGSARSEWVTELRPGVSVAGRGARLRFDANYSANAVYRAREGNNDLFHNLNANGYAELVRQLLFVDARATVFQQNVSVYGPQAESNINNTGNRATGRTFLVSPYLRHEFGSEAQGEARYTYSTVNYSAVDSSSGGSAVTTAGSNNSESNRIDARLFSGPAYKLLTWDVAYSKEHIDYTETQQKVDTQMILANGRRLITPNFGLLATVGYEDNDYGVILGEPPKGKIWSWGLEWTPTPRTRLAATTGRRYYGPNQSLDFSHRTRLTTWRVSYNESVTTNRQQLLAPGNVNTASYLDALFSSSIPDPIARAIAVQNFITLNGLPATLTVPLNFISTTPFLMKRLEASFGIQGVRNTVLANVFSENRSAVGGIQSVQSGAGDFSQASSTKAVGTGLLWSLRITEQTTSNASINYTRTETPGLALENKTTYFRLGVTQQFLPKVTGSLNYRRIHNESNQAGGDYTENAVSALLNMRF